MVTAAHKYAMSGGSREVPRVRLGASLSVFPLETGGNRGSWERERWSRPGSGS